MARCKICGKKLADNVTMCTECGAPVSGKNGAKGGSCCGNNLPAEKTKPKKDDKGMWFLAACIFGVAVFVITVLLMMKAYNNINKVPQVEAPEVLSQYELEQLENAAIKAEDEFKDTVKGMGVISSTSFYYSHTDFYIGEDDEDKTIYTCDGVITAGVDLKKAEIDINRTEMTMTITVPQAMVMANNLDDASFQLFDKKSGDFKTIKVGDKGIDTNAIKKAEEAKAIEKGVLTEAQSNAKNVIEKCILELEYTKAFAVTVILAE